MKELSRGLEALFALLVGALAAPIAAAAWWVALNSPICDTGLGTVDCVVTASGEYSSWALLTTSPEALVLALILAVAAFLALEAFQERPPQLT